MHHRFARSAENIAIVSENVAEDPNVSVPRRSQELGLSYDTLWHLLHLDLHLHPYKAHFTVCGYVNKQNCGIWGSENPQAIEERP